VPCDDSTDLQFCEAVSVLRGTLDKSSARSRVGAPATPIAEKSLDYFIDLINFGVEN
jgi:hypothetical protein